MGEKEMLVWIPLEVFFFVFTFEKYMALYSKRFFYLHVIKIYFLFLVYCILSVFCKPYMSSYTSHKMYINQHNNVYGRKDRWRTDSWRTEWQWFNAIFINAQKMRNEVCSSNIIRQLRTNIIFSVVQIEIMPNSACRLGIHVKYVNRCVYFNCLYWL